MQLVALQRFQVACAIALLSAERVLVVDDEVRLADGLRRGLEAEGCAVDVAHDGLDGLWYAQEFDYDVIVLDWMMPQMNGWKVLTALREAEDWTPVIMLTARDADRDQVEALGSGADDYVTKPFSFAVLIARIRNLARRGAVERPDVLEAGSLRLDPGTHAVRRGETEIELTSREFAVLHYLMADPAYRPELDWIAETADATLAVASMTCRP